MRQRNSISIFVSYARQDYPQVAQLYQQLKSAGFNPWFDKESLDGGILFEPAIENAVRKADLFIACVSSHSITKRGFLQKELMSALEIWRKKGPDDIYLIPVRLDQCKVPERLAQFHYVDLFESGGLEKLIRSVENAWKRKESETDPQASSPVSDERPRVGPALSQPANLLEPPELQKELPSISFPEEMDDLLEFFSPGACSSLQGSVRRFLLGLGTKLEPIVQIVPRTPVPLVIGFECLALGQLGESFADICARTREVDSGIVRLLLSLAAMKTAETLWTIAARHGVLGAKNLVFTVNLDPEMLDSRHLEPFLERYQHIWEGRFLFEVSERTTRVYLKRLRDLQVDFKLRYVADDYNAWNSEAKRDLQSRVEMSKVDCATFFSAMDIRGNRPKAAITALSAYKIGNKPLILEGLEQENYLRFLNANWPANTRGAVFAQGYRLKPGVPWETWTVDLQAFGLPGGHILADKVALAGTASKGS
jgi:hypothetical protein